MALLRRATRALPFQSARRAHSPEPWLISFARTPGPQPPRIAPHSTATARATVDEGDSCRYPPVADGRKQRRSGREGEPGGDDDSAADERRADGVGSKSVEQVVGLLVERADLVDLGAGLAVGEKVHGDV